MRKEKSSVKLYLQRKIPRNILVVGRVGCGKTTFVRNIGKNKLFGNIKEVCWISVIELSTDR